MLEVSLADTPETSRIDVCPLCHFVWFDASEVSELQPRAPSSVLSPEARRAMALVDIQRSALAAKGHDLDGALLDTWWKKVIRYLGLWAG